MRNIYKLYKLLSRIQLDTRLFKLKILHSINITYDLLSMNLAEEVWQVASEDFRGCVQTRSDNLQLIVNESCRGSLAGCIRGF